MSKKLFEEFKLGDVRVENRVVMAPMTRSRATPEHVPTELMAEYYAQRAAQNLLITEGTAPDPNGTGYPRIPGLYDDAQVEAWKKVTAAVHARGGVIAAQLMHTGRVGHPLNMPKGSKVLAPSATQAPGEMFTDQEGPQAHPKAEAMTHEEVEAAVQGFADAAKSARAAGFDLVEIHGANGYLVEQFLCPTTNLRTDDWGGAFENRARFALAVIDATSKAIGAERVGIRLSPYGVFNGIEPWEGISDDYVWLAKQLSQRKVAYLHLVDHSAIGSPALPDDIKPRLREAFSGAFILSGGYDGDRAEADLAEGKGDLVAFGRPYLANPDLVERLRKGAPLNDPQQNTFYTPGPEGYTDYPELDSSN